MSIKDIKKYYREKNKIIKALAGVSFDIHAGEIISLLGVNGAGKSTLSSIIATLHPPTNGDITFNGKSIYKNLVNYRLQLGFCPQTPNLDNSLTLKQNLYFAGCYYRVSESVVNDRLHKLVEQFELEKYLDYKADVLSGGYRQRFMIARCLMHNPKLVLLDEPTVGLDPHVRRQLWEKIKQLKQEGVTVILTTHYMDEAEQLSDRVCIIDKGLIKLINTPKELLRNFNKNNLEEVFLGLIQDHKDVS